MELELVFNWVIKSSIMASILAVLILLVKYALRNKLDAKWQYAIWMLLIIRLLMPYDIQSPWSIYSLLPKSSVISPIVNQIKIPDIKAQIGNISGQNIQLTNDQFIINKQSNAKADGPISKDLSYGWILGIVWLVGALILGILTLATNLRFYLKVRREPFVKDARMTKLMHECTRKLGIRKNLPILIMNGIDSPCLFGIISPKLLLPKSLVNRLNEENMRHIFFHELSHYKRNDILINWVAVAAQIVHWFNPLIWYSFAKMREDCELACDANTLSFLRPEEYQSYGLSIISLLTPAQSTWLPGTTGFFGNKNNLQIKRRIKMIKFFRKPTSKWTWTAVVIFISLGLVGFTNSISNATPSTGTPLAGINKPLEANISSNPAVQVQKNKMTRNGWDLNVESIVIDPMTDVSKGAAVYFTFKNKDGLDKEFIPTGKIQGLVGTSGKLYEMSWNKPVDESYTNTKDSRKQYDEAKGIKYEPGKFGYAVHLMVDGDEENFTKVIYQDENGNKEEIPIQDIVPEIAQNHNATEVLHPSEPLFLYFQVA